jgi:uncharacterized MAPEG superfamily protein
LPTELLLLTWSVGLLLAHIAVQFGFAIPLRGLAWNAGPQDEGQPPLGRYAGRAQRALDNYKETYPAFLSLALALVITNRTGSLGEVGAYLWFAARVAYLPLYLLGVPWSRPFAFGLSLIGLSLMMVRLVS